VRGFFSRFFNADQLDTGMSIPPSLTGPSTESGLDIRAMEAALTEIDLDTAIASHENWKLRLQNVLDGKSSEILQPEVICLDNCCDLGQWLHGPGGQRLGHHPEFQVLIARHKYFHMQAELVATQANNGDIDKALHTFHSSYRQASSQIILLLQQLKRNLDRPD